MKVSYSDDAIQDLIRLKEFIQVNNPSAAQKAAYLIVMGISQLKEFPRLGVKVELAPDPEVNRDLIIRNYICRYLITDQTIYILRIWHHKEYRKK